MYFLALLLGTFAMLVFLYFLSEFVPLPSSGRWEGDFLHVFLVTENSSSPVFRCSPGCYWHCCFAITTTIPVLPRAVVEGRRKPKIKERISTIVHYLPFLALWTKKRGFFLELLLCTQWALLVLGCPWVQAGQYWRKNNLLPIWWNFEFCCLFSSLLAVMYFHRLQISVAFILFRIFGCIQRDRHLHGVCLLHHPWNRNFLFSFDLRTILKYTKVFTMWVDFYSSSMLIKILSCDT